jgi:hypothetical protein
VASFRGRRCSPQLQKAPERSGAFFWIVLWTIARHIVVPVGANRIQMYPKLPITKIIDRIVMLFYVILDTNIDE